MSNFQAKDGNGDLKDFAAQGAGSSGDPHRPKRAVADGDDEALGAKADTAATDDTGTWSLIALFKRLLQKVTALSKAEDAAHSDGDTGVMLLAVRKDTAAALAGADGDYIPLIVDANGRLHVLPGATEAHLGQVGGHSKPATGTMTRPSDTNVYASGDGVTTATSSPSAMAVSGAARIAAGSGFILGGVATKSATGTTNAQFRVWIYQDTPSAIPNDNAAFSAAVHADYQKLVATATFDFASGIVGSDGVRVPIVMSRPNAAFKVASGTDLTVIWEARAAYTPSSGEIFRLELDIAQD
jgi:hypothetical protein